MTKQTQHLYRFLRNIMDLKATKAFDRVKQLVAKMNSKKAKEGQATAA